ncbi:MAG: 3-phosphoshikimate 1-carboxyvinyltransferase [Candidatus Omnitrophica bacterium]|nr:3-phosphoshikimate 1-carboxyvinyltransferase [Candidatus Omnitrophota bacterium]
MRSNFLIKPASRLKAAISLPGDKSIAQRAVILSAISSRKITIKNFPDNNDCHDAVRVFKKLGVSIKKGKGSVIIKGAGLHGLKRPKTDIFTGESGTVFRLLTGLFCGQRFNVRLRAGDSLQKRPMLRVTAPLRLMGAKIRGRQNTRHGIREEYPPVAIEGARLKPVIYKIPVASAQVKSAILLAALYAKGRTVLIEPVKTRDHTERMLKLFKAGIKIMGNRISVEGKKPLIAPKELFVPGDISSASFFIALAAMIPHSRLVIKDVGLNPSRMGMVRVLKRMGADIIIRYRVSGIGYREPVGEIVVKSSALEGTVVRRKEIPSLIDELPVLMVAASFARGKSVFENVSELRVKETDRIASMVTNLKKMGVKISSFKKNGLENIIIEGRGRLIGCRLQSFGDHRTAMSMVIAGLVASGNSIIDEVSCINKSFPDFLGVINDISGNP